MLPKLNDRVNVKDWGCDGTIIESPDVDTGNGIILMDDGHEIRRCFYGDNVTKTKRKINRKITNI